MRGFRLLSGLLALAGVALLVAAALRGDLHAGLFLIVPFVYGAGVLPFVAMLALMAAGVTWILGSMERVERMSVAPGTQSGRVERHGGGVVLLGSIPIVWGSSPGVRKWMLLLGAAMLGLWILVVLLTRG